MLSVRLAVYCVCVVGVPPVAVSYHRQVVPLVPGAASSEMLPAPQREVMEEVMVAGPGVEFTVTYRVMTLSQPTALERVMVFCPALSMEVPA